MFVLSRYMASFLIAVNHLLIRKITGFAIIQKSTFLLGNMMPLSLMNIIVSDTVGAVWGWWFMYIFKRKGPEFNCRIPYFTVPSVWVRRNSELHYTMLFPNFVFHRQDRWTETGFQFIQSKALPKSQNISKCTVWLISSSRYCAFSRCIEIMYCIRLGVL